MNLLIAEDDPGCRRLLKRIAQQQGYSCTTVSTSRGLLRDGSLRRPDAVVSDVCLGDGDGIDACLKLRRIHPGLPVAIMTGARSGVARARDAGFDLVLRKPFKVKEMEALLKRLELRME